MRYDQSYSLLYVINDNGHLEKSNNQYHDHHKKPCRERVQLNDTNFKFSLPKPSLIEDTSATEKSDLQPKNSAPEIEQQNQDLTLNIETESASGEVAPVSKMTVLADMPQAAAAITCDMAVKHCAPPNGRNKYSHKHGYIVSRSKTYQPAISFETYLKRYVGREVWVSVNTRGDYHGRLEMIGDDFVILAVCHKRKIGLLHIPSGQINFVALFKGRLQ